MDSFRDLSQRVRTHLCYAHVFGDALTEEQLVARCAPADPEGVRRELQLLQATASVARDGEYWLLYGATVAGFAKTRKARERAAQRVLEDHRRLIGFLKCLGVVRMLAVSGSVGWRNCVARAGKPADLDLFIITAPAGVHIVRFMLRLRQFVGWLLSRFGLVKSWTSVCANYMTDVDFLDITNPSFYTASDTLHVQVLKGEGVYRRFLHANRWIERYYPIVAPAPEPPIHMGRSRIRAALNIVCFSTMAGYSCSKARLSGRSFTYSWEFRFDRANCLKRTASSGGGYQPVVARRFRDVYTRHFGSDSTLFAFLFPGTTETGVYANGGFAEPVDASVLGYDE